MKTAFTKLTRALAVLALLSAQAAAEEKNIFQRVFFDDFGKAAGAIAAEPAKTALITAAALTAGLVIYNNDLDLNNRIQGDKSGFKDTVMESARYLGDGLFVMALDSVLFLGGEKEKKAAEQVLEALAVTSIVNYSIKMLAGRARPSATDNPGEFTPFTLKDLSFPSGHTQVAFSWATVIGDSYGIGYLTYPLAALCGLSRVYHDAHWASDVFAGAVISTFITKAIMSQDAGSSFSFEQRFEKETAMAGIKIRFN